MKRINVFLILILLALGILSAEATGTTGTTTSKAESALNLLIPDDTLKFRFASDADGTVLTASPTFYLLTASVKNSQYAVAYTSFYVWYDVFIGKSVKLVLETDTTFSYSTSDSIPLAGKTNLGVAAAIADGTLVLDETNNTKVLIEGKDTVVEEFKDGKVSVGSKLYYLALDITKAKSGSTYSGNVKLKVEVCS